MSAGRAQARSARTGAAAPRSPRVPGEPSPPRAAAAPFGQDGSRSGRKGALAGCLAAAVTAAVLALVVHATPAGRSGTGAVASQVAELALAVAALVLAACTTRRRARRVGAELTVWRCFTRALGVLAGGVITAAAVSVTGLGVGAHSPAGGAPSPASVLLTVAVIAACPLLYQGLVHWNRYRSTTAGPGDWLNGVGAVLILTAMGTTGTTWLRGPGSSWPWWWLQLWVLAVACLLMLLGTAVTVAFIGGLRADARIWLTTAAVGLLAAQQVLLGVRFGREGLDAGGAAACWALTGALLATSATPTPSSSTARAVTTRAHASGSLVVLVAGVGALAVAAVLRRHPPVAAVVCVVVALALVSLRSVHLIRSLDQLARTRQESLTDPLTGLANRRALQALLDGLDADGAAATLAVIDLDGFKAVNDRFGHAVGDELLRHVATRLQVEVSQHGTAVRLGGDEFAYLLPGERTDDALAVAEALHAAVGEPVDVGGHRLLVACSIGIATRARSRPAARAGAHEQAGARGLDQVARVVQAATAVEVGEEGSERLLRDADTAMYAAKAAGGGTRLHDRAAAREHREQARLVEELKVLLGAPDAVAGVACGELVVHYQPQLDLRTDEVTGAEALVRWQHPRLGLVGPQTFVDLVERHGLMTTLTTEVVQIAVQQAALWREQRLPLRVAVNVSASCFTDPTLLCLVLGTLREHRVRPHELVLEITETTLMSNPAHAATLTRELAAHGVGISIDDYGTGYSSLAYLDDLPAAELKVDRSFTSRLLHNPRTRAIVAGTVALAHELGLRLLVEGVEDEDTLRLVRRLGADEVQGFVHSRPLPADAFTAWCLDRNAAAGTPGTATHLSAR
ncbi:putative bifunctional diguanylate cyclase/phosphodiesterase [Kineococcus sp. G2]|uniref:putative bifunctional diguanylate cyclase/phosphodiesterase n=1 Tax=Kineococcus sp. G2 TaxID=3127484 RepID=UPI00301D6EDB